MCEFLDRPVHGIDCRTRERLGDITDPAANQSLGGFRIGLAKCGHPPRDFREKIACLKFKIIFV